MLLQAVLLCQILTAAPFLYTQGKRVQLSVSEDSEGGVSGIVEVWENKTWSRVCHDRPHVNDTIASVLCKMMRLSDTGITYQVKTSVLKRSPAYSSLTCPADSISVDQCSFGSLDDGGCAKIMAVHCQAPQRCATKVDGSFVRTECSISNIPVYLCPGSTSEVYRVSIEHYCVFTHPCSKGQGSFYQSCGCPGVEVEQKQCKSVVCEKSGWYSQVAIPSRRVCDGYYDCIDKSDEEGCLLSEGQGINCTNMNEKHYGWVPSLYICDSYSDCKHGEDEVGCGFKYGIYCNISFVPGWVDRKHICDNKTQCDEGEDEMNCDFTAGQTCKDHSSDKLIWKPALQTCTYPMSYSTSISSFGHKNCQGLTDQMNCTTDHVLSCTVKGYNNTRVRDRWLCNNWKACDGGEDEMCFRMSPVCTIHKYQLCDGVDDCAGGEDEYNCLNTTTDLTCQRHLTLDKPRKLRIPVEWLCDGVKDCVGGEDEEQSLWMVCGRRAGNLKCYPKTYKDCRQGFICPDRTCRNSTAVQLEQLCDSVESCSGAERDLCTSYRQDMVKQVTYVYKVENRTFVPPCLPGLIRADSYFTCQNITRTPDTDLLKSEVSYVITEKQPCKYRFGPVYHMLARQGLCREAGVKFLLQSDSNYSAAHCSETQVFHYLDRHSHVREIVKINDTYSDEVFICDNGKCLDGSNVCNLVDDCGDGSDELHCVNSFKCTSGYPKYITHEKVCDNKHNCMDSSDECSGQCTSKQILSNVFYKLWSAVCGALATLLNLYIIYCGFVILRQDSTHNNSVVLINNFFVVLIAVGDLTMGIYLLTIFMVDIYFGDTYCSNMFSWLTSDPCAFIGVFSTFGTELSLFSMVCLSIFRAISCLAQKYSYGTLEVKKRLVIKCSVLIGILITLAALIISILPILAVTEDYFINGLYYRDNNLFPKEASMDIHLKVISAYKEHAGDTSVTPKSWKYIREFITSMFTEGYPGIDGKPLRFYGNDGVCVFKYFTDSSDSQRGFTIGVILLNLMCFFLILLCYLYVIYSVWSWDKSFPNKNSMVSSKTQLKIWAIIISDFVTWVPFIVMALLHAYEVIDATRFYQLSSVVLLPLNSVINPVIYNDMPWKGYNHSKTGIKRIRKTMRFNSNVKGSIRADSKKPVSSAMFNQHGMPIADLSTECKL